VQRAARPSRPRLPGAATSALLLGVQDDSSGKCLATAEPNQPSGLTATAVSSSQINLAWTADATPAPNQASYYDVERSPDGLGSWTSIGSTTSNSLSNTGLPAATQFYYRVTAYNCFGGSLPSATANATTQAASAPTAPTGVSASASTTAVAVTITWTDASTDETGFYVYRNTTNTTTGATLLSTLGAGVQTYTDNATNNPSAPPAIGTVYYYWVSAYNGVGESSKTAASQNATGGVTTLNVPAAPTSLTATATSTTQIDLAWTDNATNETGYTVERRSPAGSGSYSTVTTLSAGATSFSNTGLTESTQYEYRVYATNAAGNSANSNAASKFTIPATPTGLTATAVSSSQINLAWTDVSTGNTGQRIERRSPSGSGSYSTLTTVSATATTYSDTGLTASTSYEYRIVATNADYDSSPSTAANATTQSGTSTYSVEYLTVAGGGSGAGGTRGGGGGAGGYKTATGLSLTVGNVVTVTVGAGAAAPSASSLGIKGNDSSVSGTGITTITAEGGGRGGGGGTDAGGAGGSGGGGGYSATAGGAGSSGQGSNGGAGASGYPGGGGGGGGASAAGAAGTNGVGGAGGAGTSSSISGSAVVRGGGGGGAVPYGTITDAGGAGGSGGGGRGAGSAGNSVAGSANTGGGGGGGAFYVNSSNSSAGGSGVVILRMATANYSGTTTGSPTVTTSGSDTILTFNASGSYTA
jgi:hypothetical protein